MNHRSRPPKAEIAFLQEGGVTVTATRFIVEKDVYPVAGIASVKRSEDPSVRLGAVGFAVLAGLALVACLAGGAPGAFAAAASVALLASVCVAFVPVPHLVVLQTSGGEVKALRSADGAMADRVVRALNDAIVARG